MEELVRELRKKEYYGSVHNYAHERVWETEEDEADRKDGNKSRKKIFDAETEEMILNAKQNESGADGGYG